MPLHSFSFPVNYCRTPNLNPNPNPVNHYRTGVYCWKISDISAIATSLAHLTELRHVNLRFSGCEGDLSVSQCHTLTVGWMRLRRAL